MGAKFCTRSESKQHGGFPSFSLIASSHFPLTHAHVAFAIAQHRVAMADSRLEEQLEALENLPFSISRLLTEMRSIDARADALQKEIAALERSVLRNGKARSGSRYVAGMASRTPCPAASPPPPSSRVLCCPGELLEEGTRSTTLRCMQSR